MKDIREPPTASHPEIDTTRVVINLLSFAPICYFLLPLILLHTELSSALSVVYSARCLDALMITLSSSLVASFLMLIILTPLAWTLSGGISGQQSSFLKRLEALCLVPLALPPTVSGIALLFAFGRLRLGEYSWAMSWSAVVGAQIFVAGPLYLRGATHAFTQVPSELREVALSLGAPSRDIFWRLALPLSTPALKSAALTAWLRALGEFGATLLFAGNLQGSTQTMPLAIYSLLEIDSSLAIGLSLWLLWGASILSITLLTQAQVGYDIER